MSIKVQPLASGSLAGVLEITPDRLGDERGYFIETYNREHLVRHGIELDFVQDNQSLSRDMGTVRGLHFQTPPFAQAKLVRCGRGVLYDVAVDLRVGSAHYGQWTGVELSAGNGKQLLIPAGFAHGFVSRTDDTEILYKCSAPYAPDHDGAVLWSDPDIGIDWGLDGLTPILSGKDAAAPPLAAFDNPFTVAGQDA